MTTLRVRAAAPPSADAAFEWALYDASGTCGRRGVDVPSQWPSADTLEIVLAASQLRIAVVALPPLPPSRVAGAATFALEDQLAGPAALHHVVFSAQDPDGKVRAIIVARALLEEIAAAAPDATRIIAEPELVPPRVLWRWCAGEASDGGFVRRPDGSAFPVDAPSSDGTIPAEISLALAEAARNGIVGREVRVDAPYGDIHFARWQRETGAVFTAGTPWDWRAAPADAFGAAVNLEAAGATGGATASRASLARLYKPALWLIGAALALHVAATIAQWGALRVEAWHEAREWTALALLAGVPADAAANPESARAALAQRYAELRHARGLPAPGDALPLLARASSPLAALPPQSVKSAAYGDQHWTLDLAAADATMIRDLDARMRASGLPALVATTPTGARMRFGGS